MAVWYGFESLHLTHTAILHIGLKSAAVVGACSFVIAPAAASFLVPWKDLLCNAGFVLLSVSSAVVPTVLFALFSPEFPLVAGESGFEDAMDARHICRGWGVGVGCMQCWQGRGKASVSFGGFYCCGPNAAVLRS